MEPTNETPTTHLVVVESAYTDGPRRGQRYSETFSPDVKPGPATQLVLKSKQEILHELSIESVILNLENSAGLLFVAYNALAGTALQAKMSGLQYSLLKLCQEAIVAVQDFNTQSSEVVGYVLGTYKWLIKGKEPLAIKQLTRAGERAASMAATSRKLAQGFASIAADTEKVLEETQTEQALQYQKKLELEKRLRELTAEKEAQAKLQEELKASIGEMQVLYQEAKEDEARESKRAFILGITSAVASAIGSGVAAFAMTTPAGAASSATKAVTQAATGGGKAGGDPKTDGKGGSKAGEAGTATAADIKKKETELKAAEKEAEADEKAAATKKASSDKADAEATKLQAEAKEAEQQAKAKEKAAAADKAAATSKAAATARQEADTKQELADLAKTKAAQEKKDAAAAAAKAQQSRNRATAVGKSLTDLSDSFKKMQEQASTAAATKQSEKMTYLTKKLEMEKQNREALSALVKYAELIKNTNTDTGIAATAVETLHTAVRCLKQVVTALMNGSLFWDSMAQFCQSLAKSQLVENISDVQDLDLDDRLEEYESKAFMLTMVQYLARWVALHSVTEDYLAAVNKVQRQVSDNIKAAPTIEDAKKQAPRLAQAILDSASQQAIRSDQFTLELEQQRKTIAQPVAAA